MRIQFINALLGGDFSALDIAITCLATYINEKSGHKASILDMTFHTRHWKKHLHTNIKRFKPDIIAMSSNTMYMKYVKAIAEEIKTHYDIPIIVGGYHASQYPQETIEIPQIDAVFIGDGEYALKEFLDRYEAKKSLKCIPGVWYKEGKGKSRIVIKNTGGAFIEKLDNFPTPNWNLWEDLDKYFYYLGMLYIIGSRGCPYRCTYCDAHGISKAVSGRYYRIRNPILYAREVAYQWKKYEKRGMRLAQLFDQVFTFDYDWIKKFCEEYRKLVDVKKYRFSAFSRIDNLDKKKIEILGRSGCALLRVGIEAGDPFIRNEVYKKHISNEQIYEVFRLCKKNGIGFTAFYMLGGPGESKKTINTTIRLAEKLNANRSAFFIFKPFTKEGVRQIKQYGGSVDEALWAAADNITFDAVVRLKDVSPWRVELLQKKAYFFTFGRRLLWMLKKDNIRYFTRFVSYMSKGIKDGLDYHYLLPYFHIYGYDYVDK